MANTLFIGLRSGKSHIQNVPLKTVRIKAHTNNSVNKKTVSVRMATLRVRDNTTRH
jgi:hypothetical protein